MYRDDVNGHTPYLLRNRDYVEFTAVRNPVTYTTPTLEAPRLIN